MRSATWCWFTAAPFGRGAVVCRNDRIARILLPQPDGNRVREEWLDGEMVSTGMAKTVADELALFFSGARVPCLDVSMVDFDAVAGMTPFRRRVLHLCANVRRGETITYGRLAQRLGDDRRHHSRAIGQVMGWNPFPLVIPCHRVLSTDPARENYCGGPKGVPMKAHLLRLEGVELAHATRA